MKIHGLRFVEREYGRALGASGEIALNKRILQMLVAPDADADKYGGCQLVWMDVPLEKELEQ